MSVHLSNLIVSILKNEQHINEDDLFVVYKIFLSISSKYVDEFLANYKYNHFFNQINDYESYIYEILKDLVTKFRAEKNYCPKSFINVFILRVKTLCSSILRKTLNNGNYILSSALTLDCSNLETDPLPNHCQTDEYDRKLRSKMIFYEILSKLDKKRKTIVILRLKGFTFSEIANKLDMKTRDVANRFYNIKKDYQLAKIYFKG